MLLHCMQFTTVAPAHLHALDGHVFPILDALGLEHFGEGALALLGYKPIFVHETQGALSELRTRHQS